VDVEDENVFVELVGELHHDQLTKAADSSAVPHATTMVTLSGRYSKNSVVSRKNKCIGRLRKITINGTITAAKRDAENRPVDMAVVEQPMSCAGPGDFIALAFEGEGRDPVWIQKTVRMRHEGSIATKRDPSKSTHKKEEIPQRAPLSGPRSSTLTFLGSWLTPVARREFSLLP
jgi:hypothetical protein